VRTGLTLAHKHKKPKRKLKRARRSMRTIVSQINPESYRCRTKEFSADKPVGREIWQSSGHIGRDPTAELATIPVLQDSASAHQVFVQLLQWVPERGPWLSGELRAKAVLHLASSRFCVDKYPTDDVVDRMELHYSDEPSIRRSLPAWSCEPNALAFARHL
jgi:hypothetical protein